MSGILHRITPDHYNLYDEEENLVGSIHRFMAPIVGRDPETHVANRSGTENWYGRHVRGSVTATYPERRQAAHELEFHDEHHAGLHDAGAIVGPEYIKECPLCKHEEKG